MHKKKFILLVILCFLLTISTFSSVSCKPASPVEPIKIGAINHMTGFLAELGEGYSKGLQLRIEEANYEVAGRRVELIIEDDATEQALSQDKARKLVELNEVSIVIGPTHSGFAMGLAPYFAEKKVINIAFDSHPWEISEYGWTFVGNGTNSQPRYPWGLDAYRELGHKMVTTLGPDYVWGHQAVGGFNEGFKEAGGTVIQEQWYPLGTADFAPFLTTVKDADVLAVIGASLDLVRIVKQYWEFGLDKKMSILLIQGDDIQEETLQELGELMLGMKGEFRYLYRLDNSLNKEFVAAVEKKFGMKPNHHINDGYIALSIALAALEATGGDTTPEKLRQAMFDINLATATGNIRFDSLGFGSRDHYIAEVKLIDGRYVWWPLRTVQTSPRPFPGS